MGNYVWDDNGIWALRVGSLRVMTDSSVIVLISGFMVLLPAFPWVFKPNAWQVSSKFFLVFPNFLYQCGSRIGAAFNFTVTIT